jgi:hypothetical protein
VQYVVAPYPCYFLTTNYYFRLPLVGTILNVFGAIPKIQFSPDMRSMRGTLLHPVDDQCVVFDDPVKWNAWQRRNMIALLQDDDFQIHAKVKDLRIADKYYGPYRSCGCGEMFLRKDGMHFRGKVDGQTTELFFPMEMMPSVSTEYNYDFEVCDNKNAWWFFLEEEQQTVRIEMAISLIYELKHA